VQAVQEKINHFFFFEHINSSYNYNIHWLDVEEDVQQEQEPSHDVDGAVLRNVLANQSNLIGKKLVPALGLWRSFHKLQVMIWHLVPVNQSQQELKILLIL